MISKSRNVGWVSLTQRYGKEWKRVFHMRKPAHTKVREQREVGLLWEFKEKRLEVSVEG